jgi:hypothetical protein
LKISDAGNTQNPALRVLIERGFFVCGVDGAGFNAAEYRATRGHLNLQSDTLTGLLGLAAIHDRYGSDWQSANNEMVWEKLPACGSESPNLPA